MRTTAAALALLAFTCSCAGDPGPLDAGPDDAPAVDLGAELGSDGGSDAAVDLAPDAAGLDAPSVDAGRDAAGDLEAAAPDAVMCRPGFADCDGDPSNGCEADTSAEAGNCGTCGNRCNTASRCVGGACAVVRGPGCPAGCATNADCVMCASPGGTCCYAGRCMMLLRCP